MGLAMPVVVGGRVVAVLYGDGVTEDGREQVVPSPWPEALEILSRHAAKCLEALTVQKVGIVHLDPGREEGRSRGMRQPPALAAAAILLATIGWGVTLPAQQALSGPSGEGVTPVRLTPTTHPPVPGNLNALWYAPPTGSTVAPPLTDFVKGVRLLEEDGNAAAALPLLSQRSLASTPLADYARFYTGKALLELRRYPEAEAAFAAVASRSIEGHLPEDAAIGRAQALEASVDFAGAVAVYEELLQRKLAAPHAVLSRLAAAAEAAGNVPKAIEAFRRVYFEYPLSIESSIAESALTRLNAWSEDEPQTALELKRADALFQARRWEAARTSYERASDGANGAERDRVSLRMAAADVQLKRYRQARDPLRGQTAGPYADEANFYYITALRGLGERDEYERLGRSFADSRAESPFAQEMLNDLATHFIVADDDERADELFRIMIERYPGRALSPSAPTGAPAGGPIAPESLPRPPRCSIAAPPSSRAPTTARRGPTGAAARGNRPANPCWPTIASRSRPPTTSTATTAGWRGSTWRAGKKSAVVPQLTRKVRCRRPRRSPPRLGSGS